MQQPETGGKATTATGGSNDAGASGAGEEEAPFPAVAISDNEN